MQTIPKLVSYRALGELGYRQALTGHGDSLIEARRVEGALGELSSTFVLEAGGSLREARDGVGRLGEANLGRNVGNRAGFERDRGETEGLRCRQRSRVGFAGRAALPGVC
ncbi:MAG: hypothetical protein DRJ42_07665 [Deltaproteobacteria bacterium]|nr:MAG: hypothetical protein DRJ42_07665 [Deltaproteobacteria bacterium]